MFGVVHQVEFVVSEGHPTPLLSDKTCLKLGLLKQCYDTAHPDVSGCIPVYQIQTTEGSVNNSKAEFLNKNKDVFTGVGRFPGW